MKMIYNIFITLGLFLSSCGSSNIDVSNDFVLAPIRPVNSIQREVPRLQAKKIKDFIASTQVEIRIEKKGSMFTGRGTILKSHGVIVTAYHVIDDADVVMVYIGNQAASVKVLTKESAHDIALLSTGSLDLSGVPNVRFDYIPEDESRVMMMVNHLGFLEGKMIDYDQGRGTLYMLYSNPTEPGTSGCGVFDEDGELVGVHFGLVDKVPAGTPILFMRELEYDNQ